MKFQIGDKVRIKDGVTSYSNLRAIQERDGYLTVANFRIAYESWAPTENSPVYGFQYDRNGSAHWLHVEINFELYAKYLKKPKQFKLR